MTMDDRQKHAESIQGWIRTIWPILMTGAVILMGYTNLEARVAVLETTVQQMQECIINLEEGQSQTNVALGIMQTNIENIDSNLERLIFLFDEDRGSR